MRPRWHKVVADLFSHKIRSLLVIASIAIGLFAIGMISTSYQILSEDMRSGYLAIHPANIQIRSLAFDQNFVDRIGNLPGIEDTQGARNFSLQVRTSSGEWTPINIKALSDRDLQEQAINETTLLQGIWPPDDRQIVIDTNKLHVIGAQLGDTIEIKLPSGTIRQIEIAGIVRDQTVGAGGGDGGFFLAPIQSYVTYNSLAWLEQPENYNTLYITVDQQIGDKEAIRVIANGIVDEFNQGGYMVISSSVRGSTDHPNIAYVDAMIAVMYALGFLVVFLSGFLITNTISALLNQQVEQIGIMKTIGGTRGQIISVYMVLILVFSVIALAISIYPSQVASYGLLRYLSEQINFNLQGNRAVPASLVLQIAVALIVPQIAGSWPILKGTRISVREALSGNITMRMDDHGFIYRLLSKIRGISRPLMISLRNTFRQRTRLLLTLVTLSLGGAIFIATFNVRYSIESYIERLGHYFVADVNLTLNQPYRIERIRSELLEVPGVESVEGWTGASAQIIQDDGTPGESIQVIAPPADSPLIEPILMEGRWIEPGDQNAIALSELFQEAVPGLEVGDSIRLRIGQSERDWVVVGFFQFAGRSAGLFAYADYEYVAGLTGTYGRSAFFRVVGSGNNLDLEQQEALAVEIVNHLAESGYETSEVTAGRSLQEKTSQGLNILTTFLLIQSLLLASVGSIGLMGTMSLNVMERTREIGVMRAVGGSDRAIMNIILVEGSLIGLLSWVLACIAAIPISKVLADVIFQIIFAHPADMAFSPTGYVIWFGVVIFLSVLASVIPAYNASRLTIREVLAYE